MNTITPTISAALPSEQRRAAGSFLIAGPAIFFLGELISATAWTHPAYSYTYNFISDLGVRGPSTLFGQYMYSPLSVVMNIGFFLFGITIAVGIFLLRGLTGWRHGAVLTAAAVLAIGGILLSVFPGSGQALEDGTGEFHSLGAFAGFLSANIMAIMLGLMRSRLGFSRALGRLLMIAGLTGLVSTVLYLVAIFTAGDTIIGIVGLIERGAVYPFLISLIISGAVIWKRSPHASTRQTHPQDKATVLEATEPRA